MTFPEMLGAIGLVFVNLAGFIRSTQCQVLVEPHDPRCDLIRWGPGRECHCPSYRMVKDAPRQVLTRGDLIARNLPLSLLGRWLSEKPYAIPDPPPAPAVEPISAVREAAALTGR